MADDQTKPEDPRGKPVPADIKDRIKRGREAMTKDANHRKLCLKFWRGEQNWYLKLDGSLGFLENAVVSPKKQPHRIRNQYRFIHSVVEGKVSAATQRVPGYEITPSTGDPQDIAAARLSSQFAPFIYDKAFLRRAHAKLVTNALVQREGFARPYFDQNVGPFREEASCVDCRQPHPGLGECLACGSEKDPKVEQIGQGAIRVRIHSRSEVMWEPATDFDESRWHAIEYAMVIDEVKQIPGFVGGSLKADAETRDIPTERKSDNMVVVTEYLERPCPKYPEGRRCFIACDRIIVEPEDGEYDYETYPVLDPHGDVADEPALHRLSYTVDPEGDDRGMVEHLIDLARTIDDCYSKLLEWKNRCLMPQGSAPRGANVTPIDDTPGAIRYYNVIGGKGFEWEPAPRVPSELFQILELAKADLRAIAADVNVVPEPDLAARTANVAVEQAQLRWQSFLGDFAEVTSRIMRHCLTLAALHYSHEQQVEIRGQYGWEPLQDFTGQDLRSQVNVRVLPGSLESKSRAQVMREVEFLATTFPGALNVETALAALHNGTAEGLIKSYENHIARANEVVRLFRKTAGPDGTIPALEVQPRLDEEVGDPRFGFMVPGWMPRKQDNLVIHKQVIGDYMVTPDFDSLPIENKHMFDKYWDALEYLEQMRAMKLAMQEQGMAADQGMANAAKPQGPVPAPQQQPMGPEQGAPEALTPA